ncbi:MAG: amino acid ABC transporter substrate-binding protein, partial [Vulcanimicrobiaceae bacterium]
NVGAKALAYTYTYPTPPLVRHDVVNLGDNTDAFVKNFTAAIHQAPNFLDAAGYNTGLIIQDMIAKAPQFTQLDFHQSLMDMSGKTNTVLGDFKINENGAQLGELLPVAQLVPQGNANKIVVVYPPGKGAGKAVYPAPHN